MSRKSFAAYIKGISKKWVLLVCGGVGGALTIINLAGITPSFPWYVGFIIFTLCLLIAGYLAYHDLFIEKRAEYQHNQKWLINPNQRYDVSTALQLNEQMNDVHGHDDFFGIQNDFKSKIDVNEILNRNCTRCGKPRNQKGGYVY